MVYKKQRKIRVLTIFGTRPEAVKLAPVIKKLEESEFHSSVCVTAQHRQMLDQALNLFNITADYDLDIMKDNQTLFDITSSVLMGVKSVLEQEKPDIILVQGDTSTTFAASLAAFYCKISIGHIEAGLRTHNKYQPYPEEVNRKLTTSLADLHFPPTPWARENLLRESIPDDKITVTGNTVIDALLRVVEDQSSEKAKKEWSGYFSDKFGLNLDNDQKRILITGHRRESFGEGFENICQAIKTIANKYPDTAIIYPVHLNPNVQKPVKEILGDIKNIHLIAPLDYAPFVYLISRSYLILTDSGGIQEEAPSLGKPVLVMRELTERPEAVKAGTSILVGTDTEKIINETIRFFEDEKYYEKISRIHNPYGDGTASEKIVNTIRTLKI